MDSKRCRDCGEIKAVDEFYRHPQMADGRLNSCKECRKAYQKGLTPEQRERRREYERQRFMRPERKAQVAEIQQRRRARYPDKNRARHAVSNAIRDGKLERGNCEVCGCENAQAHHEDYSRPLDVRWLCFRHHREEHGQVVGF